jgi:t-SNARE complex subunit (syntaxin)
VDKRPTESMNKLLTKKCIDVIKIYQQAQQKYKTDIKNKVIRQVQVVKPDVTDEEIDDVYEKVKEDEMRWNEKQHTPTLLEGTKML